MEYKEIRFEQDIETFLLSPAGGYQKGDLKKYDKDRAMDMETLISFVKTTQPKEWDRFERMTVSDVEKKFFKAINDAIDNFGLIHVLRHGFKYRGIDFKAAYFKPESELNMRLWDLYNENVLHVTRQFRYSTQNNNSVDMVLSLNGIPIVALELKNQITGQSIDNSKTQYMFDRDPKETVFHFNKRILVYFGVDLYNVVMTTKLDGKNTYFLPFDQGSNGAGVNGGKGNPQNPEGYATAYLWEKVLQKDSLLDIIHRFIHLQVKEVKTEKAGKEKIEKKKTLIFPRYHQLDVVKKLVSDVKVSGSGKNYLIQHSAGSGKSNSIAWTSYRLASLHNEDNKSIFASVIIVTDRKVLDDQLQDTISSFDHQPGLVDTIGEGKTSKDLRDAINDGKRIIVTTLQKFPVIYQEIDANKGRNFAIIVDEAHSSQTGQSAMKLKTALADTEEALREYAEIEGKAEDELLDEEDKLIQEIITHGKHKNLSFFAFTATPKEKTLEMFGTEAQDGSFHPFHVYSMRQAIEEGFILDVLKNYMTYRTCFRIAKNTPENPEVPVSLAAKTVKRFESLHPHNLQQKTAIIIEHFRDITKNKINGRAKAMVVTASRLHAVRYYHEFKRYIEKMEYTDVDILVAFSGIVKDGETDYTETAINMSKDGNSIGEKQLPEAFHDDFNMLIVAEKYQTGFDEPLLHSMFIDKKLKGVKAVQTLSRLNRIHPGKNDTFILDFVNTTEEIQEAFEPFYEETSLKEEIDVNQIYVSQHKLRDYQLYNDDDVEKFVKINFKPGNQTAVDLGKMTSLLKPVVDRYNDLNANDKYMFRRTIRDFNKWYTYITQITRMFDVALHKEFTFTSYFSRLIPATEMEKLNLDEKLKLEFYKLEQTFKGDITLNPNSPPLDNVPTFVPGEKEDEKRDLLEEIIKKINQRFEGMFNDSDRVIVEALYNKILKNDKNLAKQARRNDSEVFERSIFPKTFERAAQESYSESMKSFSKLFEDKAFYNTVMEVIAREAYKNLRTQKHN
ncbi:type I restriction endonuclease subunit R [Proteiniclasticum ruminis]|uniref:Type I restriction enzyme, R subunit n=1 Tax=Proteiniclasticum ruminis TaxID=398199 RepID=A0A1G8I6S5_9CLOT|nr:DEAD/DEAH box helicase family protein [Proteiniclasticum ruminis]SDI14290.1 type I restriction enzyme, R subunit [Proteiniclasticum ruminis]